MNTGIIFQLLSMVWFHRDAASCCFRLQQARRRHKADGENSRRTGGGRNLYVCICCWGDGQLWRSRVRVEKKTFGCPSRISHHYSGWIKRGTLWWWNTKESGRGKEGDRKSETSCLWLERRRMLRTLFKFNQTLNLPLLEFQRCSTRLELFVAFELGYICAFKIYMRCSQSNNKGVCRIFFPFP